MLNGSDLLNIEELAYETLGMLLRSYCECSKSESSYRHPCVKFSNVD